MGPGSSAAFKANTLDKEIMNDSPKVEQDIGKERAVETGGSAFPRDRLDWSNLQSDRPEMRAEQAGMTLRDYFAAKALQGICASSPGAAWTNDRLAAEAYDLANAMLKARQA